MTDLEIKAAVRERDEYRCVDCRVSQRTNIKRFGTALDVHRLTPGSPYSMDGCVTVCRRCHKRRHRKPGYLLSARLRPGIGLALKRYIAQRRPRTHKGAVVEMALEDLLTKLGFYPLQSNP